MQELRVPTIATAARVTCSDGKVLIGRVFIPQGAFRHTGPMRPEEWINETTEFFPFLAEGEEQAVLLNKDQVAAVTIPAPAPDEDAPPVDEQDGVRHVVVECGALRLEGELRIDMPEGQRRVLDMLNRPERFVTLHAGPEHHLVHKRHVTRVLENRGR